MREECMGLACLAAVEVLEVVASERCEDSASPVEEAGLPAAVVEAYGVEEDGMALAVVTLENFAC